MFYYLFGTSNYANAVLSRMIFSSTNEDTCLERFNRVLVIWSKYINTIIDEVSSRDAIYDATSSLQWHKTWNRRLAQNLSNVRITIVTNSALFAEAIEVHAAHFLKQGIWTAKSAEIIDFESVKNYPPNNPDYLIYFKDNNFSDTGVYDDFFANDELPIRGNKGTFLVINNHNELKRLVSHQFINRKTAGMVMIRDECMHGRLSEKIWLALSALRCLSESNSNKLIFPKYDIAKGLIKKHRETTFTPFSDSNASYRDFKMYVEISNKPHKSPHLNQYGIRGKQLYNPELEDAIFQEVNDEKFQRWLNTYTNLMPHLDTDEEYVGCKKLLDNQC